MHSSVHDQLVKGLCETIRAFWGDDPSVSADYARIVNMMGRMEYKRRQTCLGTKVSKVAFGIGRRVPVVEKWY